MTYTLSYGCHHTQWQIILKDERQNIILSLPMVKGEASDHTAQRVCKRAGELGLLRTLAEATTYPGACGPKVLLDLVKGKIEHFAGV